MDFEDMLNEPPSQPVAEGSGSGSNPAASAEDIFGMAGGASGDDIFSGSNENSPTSSGGGAAPAAAGMFDDVVAGGDVNDTAEAAAAAVPEPVAEAAPVASFTDFSAPPVAAAPAASAAGGSHLSQFQEQARRELEERDAQADQQHQEVRTKAQALLKQLADERTAKIQAARAANVEAEQATKARNEALFADGPVWDRVVSLVDMKDSSQARKTSRMREILQVLQTSQ